MSTGDTPFRADSSTITAGSNVRQALIADRPVLAGSGSRLEAFLIAETHQLRHTPNFLGAGITAREVLDLVQACDREALLFLVDSIAADGGEALLQTLRQERHPPLVLHVTTCRRWPSRDALERFPAHALLSADSVGSGRFNAALASLLSGVRYVDEQLLRQAAQPSAATARLSDREIAVAIGVAQGQTNRAIGRQLLIAESTVRDYVSTALKKLSLSNRAALAAWATQNGLGTVHPTSVGSDHDTCRIESTPESP